MHVPFEKHVLANGLELVLHQDREAPLVTVYVAYHVGSAREEPGRTGFAHLFEHLMFQGSKHVPEGEHFRLVQEAGGTLNGNTSPDRTVYFETLPSNELELALWLESDRMGFLLDALSQATLDNQRDVVLEERRQSYENRPYGAAALAVPRELFPAGHPYSWPTIGEPADLAAASLDDVRGFFRRYYGPENATLAIGGDFERDAALELAQRYFGTLLRGPGVPRPAPLPFALDGTRRVALEDRVGVPELQLHWPGPHAGHPDAAALDVLTRVLSANRSSVLDRALTLDAELAASVGAAFRPLELAGHFQISLRPREGVSLERLEARTLELLRELAGRGVDERALERTRASYRAGVLRALELASSRTSRLAESNVLHEDPGGFLREVERRLAATPEEIASALRRYLADAPHLSLAVVPKGRADLAPAGAQAPSASAPSAPPAGEAQPDRSARPRSGPAPPFTCPAIWRAKLSNGLALSGAAAGLVPLAQLELALPAGYRQESMHELGLASLLASLLEEGTRRLSSAELQEELDALGARLQVWCDEDELRLRASVPDERLLDMLALLSEIATAPRLEPAELVRARAERLVALRARAESAPALAADAFHALVFGASTRRGAPPYGTPESVAALSLESLRAFFDARIRPHGARLAIVANADPDELRAALEELFGGWRGAAPSADGSSDAPLPVPGPRVFLLDRPGAPQCELRVGHEGVASTDPDYFRFSVLNFVFGGTFSSRLNGRLREELGYTYGARSSVGGGLAARPFVAAAAVRPEVAAPAARELLALLEELRTGLTDKELAFAKDALPRAQVRELGSSGARLAMLGRIERYRWPERYPEERRQELLALTPADLREQAERHVHPARARILVAGDARLIRAPLESLGLGLELLSSP